jgi:hypothetical protein
MGFGVSGELLFPGVIMVGVLISQSNQCLTRNEQEFFTANKRAIEALKI